MTGRETENALLTRCASVARGTKETARDQREANVFRVAAMVLQSHFPAEATALMQSSETYFQDHPAERLPAADVVRRGWIFSLPRLRDMLSLWFQ